MITIMLPAYNEAENLKPLLEKIGDTMERIGEPYRVLVVDDGSTDETAHLLAGFREKLPLHVVRHPVNLGLAETLRSGLRRVVEEATPGDVLITMDADNTHEPSHIPSMLQQLNDGFDVVIASRYQPGGKEIGLTLKRRILSRSANLLLKMFFPVRTVRDYTCGYRAYRTELLARAWEIYGERFIQATTFAAMAEILLKLRAIGMRAGEVPLVLRYDQKDGESKMRVGRTVMNYASIVWRVWWIQWSGVVREARREGALPRAERAAGVGPR